MNIETFDKLVTRLDNECRAIIANKRPEYTEGNEDILQNFKLTAKELGIDPLVVAYIFFRKHVASIGQFCGGTGSSSEPILSRLADARNYIDLIWALINEPRNFPISGKNAS